MIKIGLGLGSMYFSARRGGVTSFDPLSLSPALWLDASDASTLYNATIGGSLVPAGGQVARWEDKSGNGRNATHQSPATMPRRRVSVLNGLDVVEFGGVSEGMIIPYTLVRPYTVLLVCNQDAQSYSRILNSRSVNAVLAPSRTGNNSLFISSTLINPPWATAYEWLVTSLTSSSTQTRAFKNGNSLGDLSVANSDWGLLSIGNLGTFNEGAFGNIAEILVFPTALSDTDRQAVESYLSNKWGFTFWNDSASWDDAANWTD